MIEKKLSEKMEKLVKEIETLTVIELADLVAHLEKKFGVSSIPVAAQPAQVGSVSAKAAAEKEEKLTFTVVLTSAGDNKLGVIKAVREILPNLGLMEAKKLVESAPKDLLKDAKKEQAEEAKKKIETARGKVELK